MYRREAAVPDQTTGQRRRFHARAFDATLAVAEHAMRAASTDAFMRKTCRATTRKRGAFIQPLSNARGAPHGRIRANVPVLLADPGKITERPEIAVDPPSTAKTFVHISDLLF